MCSIPVEISSKSTYLNEDFNFSFGFHFEVIIEKLPLLS